MPPAAAPRIRWLTAAAGHAARRPRRGQPVARLGGTSQPGPVSEVDQGRRMISPRDSRRSDRGSVGGVGTLLPKGIKAGRPPVHSKRQLINGIRFRTRTGIPWRDLPARYGPWETVYGLFRRWQRDGTWHRIFEQLQAQADAKGLITWDISVDSTIARAHQHAAGARKRGICRSSRPAASSPSPMTTGPDARGVD